MKKINSGFTLIEVIIGVVVMSLAVALVIGIIYFNYGEHRKKAIAAKITEAITKLNDAQSLYHSQNEEYATKEDLLKSGILKSWPEIENEIADQECLIRNNYVFGYQYWFVESGLDAVSGKLDYEYAAVLPCVKEEYAKFYNETEFF